MDETWLKPFCPYNIILTTQSRKEVGRNISICESFNLGFLGIYFFKRKFPTFGSHKLRFPKVFFSADVNVFSNILVYFFQVLPLWP
jgi:hypothetical protein